MAAKKSIAIIGEGETEWFYFDSLRVACRYPFKIAPDIPQHSDVSHMAKLAEDYVNREYDYVICLVDMDRLFKQPKEMARYRKLRKKSSKNVIWIETNPCTEFWFLLHFLQQFTTRNYETYGDMLPELLRYMPNYEKTNHYFRKNNLYKFLTEKGNMENAMTFTEKSCQLYSENPEEKIAYSEMYKVIKLINNINKD